MDSPCALYLEIPFDHALMQAPSWLAPSCSVWRDRVIHACMHGLHASLCRSFTLVLVSGLLPEHCTALCEVCMCRVRVATAM